MKATTIIVQEKAQKEKVKMLKSGYLEFSMKGAGFTSSRFECKFCGSVVIETIDQFYKQPTIVCSYRVLETSMLKVIEVHDLMHKLLQQCNKKILHLEVEKTKLSKKTYRTKVFHGGLEGNYT